MIQEFAAGKRWLLSELRLRLQSYYKLPVRNLGAGHWDERKGRAALLLAMAEFDHDAPNDPKSIVLFSRIAPSCATMCWPSYMVRTFKTSRTSPSSARRLAWPRTLRLASSGTTRCSIKGSWQHQTTQRLMRLFAFAKMKSWSMPTRTQTVCRTLRNTLPKHQLHLNL